LPWAKEKSCRKAGTKFMNEAFPQACGPGNRVELGLCGREKVNFRRILPETLGICSGCFGIRACGFAFVLQGESFGESRGAWV